MPEAVEIMNVNTLPNVSAKPPETAPQARLRQAAQHFEAFWVAQVLKEGRSKEGTFIEGSMASRMYRDMLDETLADKLAERGVLGLAELIVRQLDPAKTSASSEAPSKE